MPPKPDRQRRGNRGGGTINQGFGSDNSTANSEGHRGGYNGARGRGNRGGRFGKNSRGNRGRALDANIPYDPNCVPVDRMLIDRTYTPMDDYVCRATQRCPRLDLLTDDFDEPVAVDVEFQTAAGVPGALKELQRIGRIAVVNTQGQVIYDTYAKYDYQQGVKVRRPPLHKGFPVDYPDLRIPNGAQRIHIVEKDLCAIFKDRLIIGHGMGNDREAITEEVLSVGKGVIDTQSLYGQVGLEKLTNQHLNPAEFALHDPRDDARATMQLFLRLNPYPPPNISANASGPTVQQSGSASATNLPVTDQDMNSGHSNAVANEEKSSSPETLPLHETDSGCEIPTDDSDISAGDSQGDDIWG